MNGILSLGKQQARVIMTQWTVLIGAAYLVLYGGETALPVWQQLGFVLALMVAMGLYAVAVRSGNWERFRWPIAVADIALVTIAVSLTGTHSNDFFLFFFILMMIAALTNNLMFTTIGTIIVCGVYVGIMYSQLGADIWRDTGMLIRLPFLFGVGLFVGVLAEEARREHHQFRHLSDVTQKMAHRYHQVASERDRTKALLEIAQLAIEPDQASAVLHQVTKRIQETVRVDRCSMVVFNEADRHAYLAASSDDPDRDVVLLLPLKHYPELEETLATGEITELHAGAPSPLLDKVRRHLPKPNPFSSWMVVPIMQNETVAGAIFLRDSRADFAFHDDEQVFCKAAALIIAGYLHGCDLMEEMRRRGRLDGLTGLLNFTSFRQELDRAIAENGTTDRPKPLTLAMVDLDNLKTINDLHGHVVGNRAIESVGRCLTKALPMARSICRYGGDEFFALLPMTKEQAAERVERVLIMLEQLGDEMPCEVSVSIGIAGFPEDGVVADDFMDSADRAMYMAKGQGGHRIQLADSGDDASQVYRAVISVNARRLVPGQTDALRTVLDELLRREEQELDSTAVQQSLRALMEAVESKDSYTKEHSREVSGLTRRMCEAVGLDERETLAVEMGGLVHDIGKIGIPDEILQKPGKLTTRERMQIEQHPEIGAQILRPLPALKEVVPLVLYHHEKWDGTGYPTGLVGEDIPIGAQIISLCDVWHALTSDRSYRPAFSDEKAEEIVREGRGRDWKPDLVDLFFRVLEEERAMRSRGERRTA